LAGTLAEISSFLLFDTCLRGVLKYFGLVANLYFLDRLFWGSCMLGMGFVQSWEGLMAARWFLGLTEAGLFPGVNFYLSCWYKRNELGIRAAIFFSAAAMAGSFGGLLAAAIQKMDGIRGIPGTSFSLPNLIIFCQNRQV
jgi:MFS family permease